MVEVLVLVSVVVGTLAGLVTIIGGLAVLLRWSWHRFGQRRGTGNEETPVQGAYVGPGLAFASPPLLDRARSRRRQVGVGAGHYFIEGMGDFHVDVVEAVRRCRTPFLFKSDVDLDMALQQPGLSIALEKGLLQINQLQAEPWRFELAATDTGAEILADIEAGLGPHHDQH